MSGLFRSESLADVSVCYSKSMLPNERVQIQAGLDGEVDQRRLSLLAEPRGGSHFGRQMLHRLGRVVYAIAMRVSKGAREA